MTTPSTLETITYEFGAVEVPGGWAPAIRQHGTTRHWYRVPMPRADAEAEALAQAQADAQHYSGDWRIEIRPLR